MNIMKQHTKGEICIYTACQIQTIARQPQLDSSYHTYQLMAVTYSLALRNNGTDVIRGAGLNG